MEQMRVRKGKEAEISTRNLYEEVFCEDTQDFISYYYSEKSRNNKVYACEQKDEIISMLHLNPYTIKYSKLDIKEMIYYIVAVATKEEYRKKGYMRKVLTTALVDMYQEQKAFTFLMPAHPAIYEPYEFAYIYDRIQYSIQEDILAKQELRMLMWGEIKEMNISKLGGNHCIAIMTENDVEELSDISNAILSRKYAVFCEHSIAYLERMQKELIAQDGNIFLVKRNAKIIGYFFYSDENSFIQEVEFMEEQYKEQLLLENQIRKPIIMARILSLETIGRYIKAKESKKVIIRITDTVITENNGIFSWTVSKSGSTFVRIAEEHAQPEYCMSIQEFTQRIFGYITSSGIFNEIVLLKYPFLNEIV